MRITRQFAANLEQRLAAGSVRHRAGGGNQAASRSLVDSVTFRSDGRAGVVPAGGIVSVAVISTEKPATSHNLFRHSMLSNGRVWDFLKRVDAVEARIRQRRVAPPAGRSPLGNLTLARRVQLDMEGGAIGNLQMARVGDSLLPIRELVAKGKAWAMNGIADQPGKPLFEAVPGETVRLLMSDKTMWPHGMHLQGHRFDVFTGRIGPARDTVLINRGETTEPALVADNPGDWLLHCHMLEHAESGKTTWFRVAAQP